MAFNGSGTFILPTGNPVVSNTLITAATQNTTMTDVANGLSNCVTKDGQTTLTANLPMAGKKLTGLGAGTASGDSVRYDELQLKAPIDSPTFTGKPVIPGYITQGDGAAGVQLQSQTAFTTNVSGTSTSYTLTTTSSLAQFTGSIEVTTGILTVTSTTYGTPMTGMSITGSGVPANTFITGPSGLNWQTNITTSVASTLMTGNSGLITNQRCNIKFDKASGASPVLSINGTTAKPLKQYNSSGVLTDATVYANQLADVIYDGTYYIVLDPAPYAQAQLQPITVAPSLGGLVVTLNPTTLDFRTTSLSSAPVSTINTTSATITIPSGSTLGTVSGATSKIAIVAVNVSGTVKLAAINYIGSNFDETTSLYNTTTIISGTATSQNVFYSDTTTISSGNFFRLVGIITVVNTAGSWGSPTNLWSGGNPIAPAITALPLKILSTTDKILSEKFPYSVKKITVILNQVSVSSGSIQIAFYLNDSLVTGTYRGSKWSVTAAAGVAISGSAGFEISSVVSATLPYSGIFTITQVNKYGGGYSWIFSGGVSNETVGVGGANGAFDVLDLVNQVAIVPSVANALTGGEITILYE
jgi:hypothetical protein